MPNKRLLLSFLAALALSAPIALTGCASVKPAVEWVRKAICLDHKLQPVPDKPGHYTCTRCGQEFKLSQ